jgi:hypothetical protein
MWGVKGCQIQAPAALRQGKNIRTHWTVSWMDPKDDLDVVKKKKIYLHRVENRTQINQPRKWVCSLTFKRLNCNFVKQQLIKYSLLFLPAFFSFFFYIYVE